MAGDTRERMILTAERLFQRDGYHSTSWRRLVEEAGTPWGSVHHHFPGGKDELAVAAVEVGSAGVLALIDHCFAEVDDPVRAVELWFDVSGRLMKDSGYESGCPIATVALETVAHPGPVRDAVRAAFTEWERRLTSHLCKAAIPRRRAKEGAISILALLEGALLLARVHEDLRPMRSASKQAQSVVAALVSPPAA